MSVTGTFFSWMRRGLRTLDGATDQVTLHVEMRGQAPVKADLAMVGPGNVDRLKEGAIVTVDPAPGSGDHRAGALPFLTFRDPALPWLMSPTTPDRTTGRLTPWLALICIPDHKATISRAGGLTAITAQDTVGWPAPADLDLGAHVHDPDGTDARTEPGPRAVSRLICLQKLQAGTKYHACVVPLYEAGRKAGLGLDPEDTLDLAWTADSTDLTLPVYHMWEFRCGPGRGAEDILRDLHAYDIPSDAQGALTIPVADRFADPISSLKDASVALRTLFSPQEPPAIDDLPALRPALGRKDAVGNVQLPLPSYGRDHAGVEDASRTGPAWFTSVNRDLSLRRLAGAGAALVRAQQDEMVTFVRTNAGALDEANAILSRAHCAKALNRGLTEAIGGADLPALARFAGPAASRMRAGGQTTLQGQLTDTTLGVAAVADVARRMSRVNATTDQTMAATSATANRMASGDVVAGAGLGIDFLERVVRASGRGALPQPRPGANYADTLEAMADGSLNDVAAGSDREMPAQADFGPTIRDRSGFPGRREGPRTLAPGLLAEKMKVALDPDNTVPPRIAARLEGAGIDPNKVLPKRILTEPVWPEPVIDQVLRMAPELLAPGLSSVPMDAIVGMRYDASAMEAIMVGANDELMRELRWRSVPCDFAVSPVRRAFPAPTRGGTLNPDLQPMADWGDTALGSHVDGVGIDFVAILRSSLIRRFPDVTVTLNKAKEDGGGRVLDTAEAPVAPLISGTLGDDLMYFGFPDLGDLMAGAGWFLAFTQPEVGLSFGLNITESEIPRDTSELDSWNALSWSDVGDVISANAVTGPALENLTWGQSAAAMARILLERPVTVGLHLSDLLPR